MLATARHEHQREPLDPLRRPVLDAGMKNGRTRRRIVAAAIVLVGSPVLAIFMVPLYHTVLGHKNPRPPGPPPCSLVVADPGDPRQIGDCTGKCSNGPSICFPYLGTHLEPGLRVAGFCQCRGPRDDELERQNALLRNDAGWTDLGQRWVACQAILRDAGVTDAFLRCNAEIERELEDDGGDNHKPNREGGPSP